jgi:elongation factor G
MQLERLRNLGIVAHIDAGKTTLSERLLFECGVEHRIGAVDEGTAVMDWMREERERGITITAAATTLPWGGFSIQLIDTPGHVDFGIEVERSLRVLDGAVLVLDAVAGVQAQTESVWRALSRRRMPALLFVNKCDRSGADFLGALAGVKRRLGARCVAVQLPLLLDGALRGTIDLLERRAWLAAATAGEAATPIEIPSGLADDVALLRAELVEALSERDDAILAAALDERDVAAPALRSALRARVLDGSLVPALCGAALRHVGVAALLDAIVDWLPSPLDVPPARGVSPLDGAPLERSPDPRGPLCAYVFKLQSEASGDLYFLRVHSGTLVPGASAWNPRLRRHERITRLFRMHSSARTALESAGPGEIVAVHGPKASVTGDTLCDPSQPIALESLTPAEPVLSLVAEPASTAERETLREALARLTREDPSFHAAEDAGTGQWTLAGMGELHLEVVLHRLRDEFGVEVRTGAPRVAYREALRARAHGAARVERALAGKEVFGAVELELEPRPDHAAGLEVLFAPDCAVPAPFRPAVREALAGAAQVGPRFGFPLAGATLHVVGGESRPRLDAEAGFVQAAVGALRAALDDASVELLEPLMAFSVETPAEFAGGILADLNARKAEIERVESSGALRETGGRVPLFHMFGYATAVRSLSQGRATFGMTPAGQRAVPEPELAARGLSWS